MLQAAADLKHHEDLVHESLHEVPSADDHPLAYKVPTLNGHSWAPKLHMMLSRLKVAVLARQDVVYRIDLFDACRAALKTVCSHLAFLRVLMCFAFLQCRHGDLGHAYLG